MEFTAQSAHVDKLCRYDVLAWLIVEESKMVGFAVPANRRSVIGVRGCLGQAALPGGALLG
ncbi:MAG: hypothetical protein ACI92G_003264 [Candidatus Pelagisphaera sp.]|jgi:hypothetical protein